MLEMTELAQAGIIPIVNALRRSLFEGISR